MRPLPPVNVDSLGPLLAKYKKRSTSIFPFALSAPSFLQAISTIVKQKKAGSFLTTDEIHQLAKLMLEGPIGGNYMHYWGDPEFDAFHELETALGPQHYGALVELRSLGIAEENFSQLFSPDDRVRSSAFGGLVAPMNEEDEREFSKFKAELAAFSAKDSPSSENSETGHSSFYMEDNWTRFYLLKNINFQNPLALLQHLISIHKRIGMPHSARDIQTYAEQSQKLLKKIVNFSFLRGNPSAQRRFLEEVYRLMPKHNHPNTFNPVEYELMSLKLDTFSSEINSFLVTINSELAKRSLDLSSEEKHCEENQQLLTQLRGSFPGAEHDSLLAKVTRLNSECGELSKRITTSEASNVLAQKSAELTACLRELETNYQPKLERIRQEEARLSENQRAVRSKEAQLQSLSLLKDRLNLHRPSRVTIKERSCLRWKLDPKCPRYKSSSLRTAYYGYWGSAEVVDYTLDLEAWKNPRGISGWREYPEQREVAELGFDYLSTMLTQEVSETFSKLGISVELMTADEVPLPMAPSVRPELRAPAAAGAGAAAEARPSAYPEAAALKGKATTRLSEHRYLNLPPSAPETADPTTESTELTAAVAAATPESLLAAALAALPAFPYLPPSPVGETYAEEAAAPPATTAAAPVPAAAPAPAPELEDPTPQRSAETNERSSLAAGFFPPPREAQQTAALPLRETDFPAVPVHSAASVPATQQAAARAPVLGS